MPAGTGGQPMGSFGEVFCVPTQQDISDNKTGLKVCVWGGKRLLHSKGYSSENLADITQRPSQSTSLQSSSLLASSGVSF